MRCFVADVTSLIIINFNIFLVKKHTTQILTFRIFQVNFCKFIYYENENLTLHCEMNELFIFF